MREKRVEDAKKPRVMIEDDDEEKKGGRSGMLYKGEREKQDRGLT